MGTTTPKQDQSPLLFKATEYCSLSFELFVYVPMGFPCGSVGKESPAMQETLVQVLGQGDPLEKEWATHSSILGLPLWLSW